jgi:hypothetical protein
MEFLNVTEKLIEDHSVVRYETYSYDPFTPNKLGNNDEIKIIIPDIESYTLPCESYLSIEGTLTNNGTASNNMKFTNNPIAYLFKEIRYDLNDVTIDLVRDVGTTSTLKGYVSFSETETKKLQNSGWFPKTDTQKEKILINSNGAFNVCVPLKILMGFFEDYKKIILNAKQQLTLIRSNEDNNCVQNTTAGEKVLVQLTKLSWRMPHITLNIPTELQIAKIINKNTEIPIRFRRWELIEYPELTKSNRHNWQVRSSQMAESAKHVILAFQSSKANDINQDISTFDNCAIRNIHVFLNSERYPYNDLYIDFDNNKFATLYEMYSKFRSSYYDLPNEPLFLPNEYKEKAPIIYIDCSFQKDTIQSANVSMRVVFETHKDIPAKTTAYCLIIYDKVFTYNPLTKIVKQM